jgi:NAD(P)H-dependent FMN reductase
VEVSKSMEDAIRIALIYGSTRPGRFCDKVVRWAAGQIGKSGKFSIEVIDPAIPATQSDNNRQEGHNDDSLSKRIERAEAFIVVTPEYNHGYPAPLKSVIDSVGAEWQAKPVAFVSYGGISGGLRAVEQLRLVFAELHTVTIRDTVSFAGAWEQFDAAGQLLEPTRAEKSMTVMLQRLHWWAMALRLARQSNSYAQP